MSESKLVTITITATFDATDLIEEFGEDRAKDLIRQRFTDRRSACFDEVNEVIEQTMISVVSPHDELVPIALRELKVE